MDFTSFVLILILIGCVASIYLLAKPTVSPDYRKEMLIAARELEELESRICSSTRRRLQSRGKKEI